MCQVNAYLERGGIEELIMENVDILEPEGQKLFLRSIFGEEKILPLRIKRVSLVHNRIILEDEGLPYNHAPSTSFSNF